MVGRCPWCVWLLAVCGVNATVAGPPADALFTVTTDRGDSAGVRLGIAALATTGIDPALGEEEVPPAPPPGVFDVRLIDPDTARAGLGEGVWVDLRTGEATTSAVTEHLLVCRCAASIPLTLHWTLDPGVIAVITLRDASSWQRHTANGTGSQVVVSHGPTCTWAITLYHHVRALTVRTFLEGAFDSRTGRMRTALRDAGILAARFPARAIPDQAVDSIAIACRDVSDTHAGSPAWIIPAWLCADGTVCPFAPPFDLPLLFPDPDLHAWSFELCHRNHRHASCTQVLPADTTAFDCDMTSRADLSAGGSATLLAPGVYGMIAGEVNGDDRSDPGDLTAVRQAIGGARAYAVQDTDLNGGVGATDLALVRRVMVMHMKEQ